VSQGYTEGYLRASIVRSPFDRVNTGDNTPAVIHLDVVPGATLKLMLMAKGGGCENRSKYTMLTPAAGLPGVSSLQITFHEDLPPGRHAMPPGGFRVAIVNCWDRPAGNAARKMLRAHFAATGASS